MPTCATCATENPPQARFCLACGTILGPDGESTRLRRLVTAVFCDLVGSTALGERLDAEPLRMVVERYYTAMREAVESHGGRVEKFIGDAIVGVFGLPHTREDDALRALRAAFAMRDVVPRLNDELESYGVAIAIRLGIQSGEIVVDQLSTSVGAGGGDVFNTAARLEAAAGAGEILVGESTARLVGDRVVLERLPPLDLRGKADPVPAFRATALAPRRAPGLSRTSLIGRDRALATLQRAFEDAVEDDACVLVTVLGAPGIGKSSLSAAFLSRLRDAGVTVLLGQALPYGDGATLTPIVDLIRSACDPFATTPEAVPDQLVALLGDANDAEAVRDRLLDLLGLGSGSSTGETGWAVRRLIERCATRGPVVVALDDLHWADPTLLDLLDDLADRLRGQVLLLCLARPDLLDGRPGWGGGKRRAVTITLEPLAAASAAELAAALLPHDVSSELIDHVARAAEGNPLYLEQFAATVAEGGAFGDLRELPLGIHALLATRLDRLDPQDVTTLSIAAIEGREFIVTTLQALVPDEGRAGTPACLDRLERGGFVRRIDDRGQRFAFAHGLLRDAAERRLAKADRATLHEALADILDQRGDVDDEVIGVHLEQAVRLHDDLGGRDERTAALAYRAGSHIARAGEKAFARIDLGLAAGLLGRAAALLPASARERAAFIPDLGVALTEVGRAAEASSLLTDAIAVARAAGDELTASRATVQLLLARLYLGGADPPTTEEAARGEIAAMVARGDDAGLAQAWVLVQYIDMTRADYRSAIASSLTAIRFARASGRLREQLQVSGDLPSCLALSLADRVAIDTTIAELRLASDPVAVATIAALEAVAAIRVGDLVGLRAATARHALLLRAQGLGWLGAAHGAAIGWGLLLLGDDTEAARVFHDARAEMLRAGDVWWMAVFDPYLAIALDRAGRHEEAVTIVDAGPLTGVPDDLPTALTWSVARALGWLRRGELQRAIDVGHTAIAELATTPLVVLRAIAFETLATIMDAAGRPDDAREARVGAIAVYREVGFTPGVVRLTPS